MGPHKIQDKCYTRETTIPAFNSYAVSRLGFIVSIGGVYIESKHYVLVDDADSYTCNLNIWNR